VTATACASSCPIRSPSEVASEELPLEILYQDDDWPW
jgi:hypothetical protein